MACNDNGRGEEDKQSSRTAYTSGPRALYSHCKCLCSMWDMYLGIDLFCCLGWPHLPLPDLLHQLGMQPLALLNLRMSCSASLA